MTGRRPRLQMWVTFSSLGMGWGGGQAANHTPPSSSSGGSLRNSTIHRHFVSSQCSRSMPRKIRHIHRKNASCDAVKRWRPYPAAALTISPLVRPTRICSSAAHPSADWFSRSLFIQSAQIVLFLTAKRCPPATHVNIQELCVTSLRSS